MRAATVKVAFPRDRPRQDVFFDTIRGRRSADDEDDADDVDTDEPAPPA